MPFSKSVPLSSLIGLIACKIPAMRRRLVCIVILFAAVLSSLPAHLKRNGANAQSSHTRLTQGPPSHNLSNLDETYANAAAGGTLKGYGLSGSSSLTAAQNALVTVNPTAYQTPNSPGALPISASNTGGGTSLNITGGSSSSTYATCRWYGFPSVSGQIVSARLKMDWSASGSTSGGFGGGGGFSLSVSTGGGVSVGGSNFSQSSSVDVLLPSGTDLTQVQVSYSLSGGGGPGTNVSLSGSVSNIRIEVEINCIASVPGDRWKGEYFNNQTLSGGPAMVRDDSNGTDFLNVNFGGGSPHSICAPATDNFSARWTRTVNFAQGFYRFATSVDNGVRLYIDGQLRLDRWGDLPPNTYRADAFLSAGAHEIKLEFIEYTGGASVSLSWTAVGGPSGSMAFGKTASQSSTPLSNATADRAIDGNTSGNWADNSVNHTSFEHQPWWQVDLGSVQQIGEVILWNRTDCCGDRLSNLYVLVSDNPFNSTDLTTTINQAGVSSYYIVDTVGVSREIGIYRSGRYVRVQLAGDNYLHLAEVEVRGRARSLAYGKPVSQSSTGFGGDAFRGVDSNTSGNWGDLSVTHTNFEHQPWWQVDLGSVRQIAAVTLWNRTDCCGDRLSNFYVLVSDNPFSSTDLTTTINQAGVSSYYTAGPAGITKEIGVNRSGRYVRVQLAGDNYLHLAEVEVRGVMNCLPNAP
jgi:NedA-like, galactose-binding domain/PA14 domain